MGDWPLKLKCKVENGYFLLLIATCAGTRTITGSYGFVSRQLNYEADALWLGLGGSQSPWASDVVASFETRIATSYETRASLVCFIHSLKFQF